MKKYLIIILAILSIAITGSCSKENEDNAAGDILNNSSWAKAVSEHPYLSNFPEFKYDFRGQYTELQNSESYLIASWNKEQNVVDEYKEELIKAGFSKDEYNIAFTKTIETKLYTCNISYGSKMISITYIVENAK